MICPNCAGLIENNEKRCPECGYVVPDKKQDINESNFVTSSLFAIFSLISTVMLLLPWIKIKTIGVSIGPKNIASLLVETGSELNSLNGIFGGLLNISYYLNNFKAICVIFYILFYGAVVIGILSTILRFTKRKNFSQLFFVLVFLNILVFFALWLIIKGEMQEVNRYLNIKSSITLWPILCFFFALPNNFILRRVQASFAEKPEVKANIETNISRTKDTVNTVLKKGKTAFADNLANGIDAINNSGAFWFCPKCKKMMPGDSKFCSKCGTSKPEAFVCPNCGKKLARNAAFCDGCGKRIGTGDVSQVKKCVKCGNVIDDGADFCIYCGESIKETPVRIEVKKQAPSHLTPFDDNVSDEENDFEVILLLEELTEAFPDGNIDLRYWSSEKWDKRLEKVCRKYKYPRGRDFLSKYGFHIVNHIG